MKFRPEAGIALVVLAPFAIWPFWHAQSRDSSLRPGSEESSVMAPELPSAAPVSAPVVEPAPGPDGTICPDCRAIDRLLHRLKAREEGAARRFESASNSLSVEPSKSALDGDARQQLQLALRRAQDDKRGAAAFRAATQEALEACTIGSGCGGAALADFWDEGCPPEHPDLGREGQKVVALSHVIARQTAACAAAACPEISCERHAETVRLLTAASRTLTALADPFGEGMDEGTPNSGEGSRSGTPGYLPALVKESEDWRDRVAALFLGGPDPVPQIQAAAEEARSLASRVSEAREPDGSGTIGSGATHDPWWRAQVLSLRLERMADALDSMAKAMELDAADRDAILFTARREAARNFRDLLVTQMRIETARQTAQSASSEAALVQRCDRRRRSQIAGTRGRIRSMRAALNRCITRSACLARAGRPDLGSAAPGLDPVSTQRLRLDRALELLMEKTRVLAVERQNPVKIAPGRRWYQSGEAVSVRIDSRATACMADTGAWVGLFPANAPRLSGGEVADAVIRRLNLRGRPWEEVFFEAPGRPGAYEVRTFTSQLRSGGMTGTANFEVVSREKGCRGFTGTWRTNFGRLQITVRNGEARGSYKRSGAYRAGFLTGSVNDRVLFGEWQSDLGGGGTRLVLNEDGKSFKGTWSHFRDEFAGTGIWRGTCEGPVQPQPEEERE